MAKVIINSKIYTGVRIILHGYLRFDSTVIAIGPMTDYQPQADDQLINGENRLVVPGFIDVHVHGGYGTDSMDNDPRRIGQMVDKMGAEGVTGIFVTTMTQSPQRIASAMKTINLAAQKNQGILGIHLEGPFISTKFNGAQPINEIQQPNKIELAKWQQLSGNRIRLLTYAPENIVNPDFQAYCQQHHIVMSVGHSDATFGQLQKARPTHVTHLFNAQRGFQHREVGVVGYAMLANQTHVELICDGYHVKPEAVKIAYKIIGATRLELITDAMEAKGMPDGQYQLGEQPVRVHNGRAVLKNGRLAGSILKYKDAFKNIIQFTGCTIEDAVRMSSTNQANEFHLKGKESLEVGNDADLNLFDKGLDLMATYRYGKLLD